MVRTAGREREDVVADLYEMWRSKAERPDQHSCCTEAEMQCRAMHCRKNVSDAVQSLNELFTGKG